MAFRASFSPPVDSLFQIRGFIRSLTPVDHGGLVTSCVPAEDGPSPSWQIFDPARIIVGAVQHSLHLSFLGMSRDALPQVAFLIGDISAAVTGLELAFDWPLALISDSIPASVTWLSLRFPPPQLPGVFEVLADATQVPKLSALPLLRIMQELDGVEEPKPIVTKASMRAAVEGLRKRGVIHTEEDVLKFWELLTPYILPDNED